MNFEVSPKLACTPMQREKICPKYWKSSCSQSSNSLGSPYRFVLRVSVGDFTPYQQLGSYSRR